MEIHILNRTSSNKKPWHCKHSFRNVHECDVELDKNDDGYFVVEGIDIDIIDIMSTQKKKFVSF